MGGCFFRKKRGIPAQIIAKRLCHQRHAETFVPRACALTLRNPRRHAHRIAHDDGRRTCHLANKRHAIVDAPLSFREFEQLPMPPGVSAHELWRHFAVLRRCAGVTFSVKPWFRTPLDISWAYITKKTRRELSELSELAGKGSALNTALDAAPVSIGLAPFVLEEIAAACHRDGFDIPAERLKKLWYGQVSPESSEEHAVANLIAVWRDSNRYASSSLTAALVERIHDELTVGIGELCHLSPAFMFSTPNLWIERLTDRSFVEHCLFTAIADASTATSTEDLFIAFHEASAVFWDLHYFPSLNGLTELAVRRVFFSQHGMPVLSYVPFTTLSTRSSHQPNRSFTKDFDHLIAHALNSEGLDNTLMFAKTITTFLEGLLQVKTAVEGFLRQMEHDEQKLENLQGLNHRQRECLSVLAHEPGMTMKVKTYADLFGVVRATARADLYSLVRLGHLKVETIDRAAVFFRTGNPPGKEQ